MKFIIDKQDESNKIHYIEIINTNIPIKISLYDLIKKLEMETIQPNPIILDMNLDIPKQYEQKMERDLTQDKEEIDSIHSISTTSSNSNSTFSSIVSDEFLTIEGIVKHKDEIEDEYLYMNDNELINEVEDLLVRSKKYGIEDYYRKNNLKYRPFNLGGLYSKRLGIKSNKQRYMIRELSRTCKKYLESDYVSDKKLKLYKKIDDEEQQLEKERTAIKKLESKTEHILDYNKECCYIFKRHELKGKKCSNYCIMGKDYCPICEIKFV